ncbi:MAG: alpha/beta fold hydrolase [Actinomycetota bacterium]
MTTAELNGIELGYSASGDGQAVFFTHGYQASKAMWEPQLSALEDSYSVIAWDLRGHGESGIPDDPAKYSHDLLIGDMAALLRHLEAEPAVLVGHSLGGYASLCFYLDHPEAVRALVLAGTGPGFRDPDARAKWNSMAERFASRLDEDGLEILKRASPEVSTAEHRSANALALAARGMLAQSDSRVMDAITEIKVPTLVLIGSEDKAFIASSEYMKKKIPGAELVTISGGGHAANMEQPEAFNAALRTFLDAL